MQKELIRTLAAGQSTECTPWTSHVSSCGHDQALHSTNSAWPPSKEAMRPRPSWPATCAVQPSQSSNTRFTTIPTGSEDQLEQEPRTQETKGSSPRTRNKRAGRAPHVVSESMAFFSRRGYRDQKGKSTTAIWRLRLDNLTSHHLAPSIQLDYLSSILHSHISRYLRLRKIRHHVCSTQDHPGGHLQDLLRRRLPYCSGP